MKHVRPVLLAMVALGSMALGGCGGGSKNAASAQLGNPAPQPLAVDIAARRAGGALHVDVTAAARGQTSSRQFERPHDWDLRVVAKGRTLKRLVNGPVRVEREPVGAPRFGKWDVHVQFSVGFALPEGIRDVDITLEPPNARRFRQHVRGL